MIYLDNQESKKHVIGGRFKRENVEKFYRELEKQVFPPTEYPIRYSKKTYFSSDLWDEPAPFFAIEKVSLVLAMFIGFLSLLSLYYIDLRFRKPDGTSYPENWVPGFSLFSIFILSIFIAVFHHSSNRSYRGVVIRQVLTMLVACIAFFSLLYILINSEIYISSAINFDLGIYVLIICLLTSIMHQLLYLLMKNKYEKEKVDKFPLIIGLAGFLLFLTIYILAQIFRSLTYSQ